MSPIHGEFGVGVIVGVGAFIEGHDDIGAEVLLNCDGLFRREAMRRAVNVTFEGHAVIVDLAGLRKREDLKAARVGEHGTRPLHEMMQAAHVADEFIAGTQVEMIGVAQHQRGVDILELFGRERLDRGLRADRREDRREQVAMRRGEDSGAGSIVFGGDGEIKHRDDCKRELGDFGNLRVPFLKNLNALRCRIRANVQNIRSPHGTNITC